MSEFNERCKLDTLEDELVAHLKRRLAFGQPLKDELLKTILLERRELSLKFTEIYDRLLEGIYDHPAQEIVRQIIRDEYPGPDPDGGNPGRSHREDLVHDLELVGISRARVIGYRPSRHTQAVIEDTLDAVHDILVKPDPQIQAIAFLRFWGEVLTAVEYESLWVNGLSRYFRNRSDSNFYWFHFVHDRAQRGFRNIREPGYRGAFTHSDHLTLRLADLLHQDAHVEEVMEANRTAATLKGSFYTQFQ